MTGAVESAPGLTVGKGDWITLNGLENGVSLTRPGRSQRATLEQTRRPLAPFASEGWLMLSWEKKERVFLGMVEKHPPQI